MSIQDVLSFLYALLGIGVIIFIHELGHFLAAKRVGVRVEKFSLGFDPTIRGRRLRVLSFRRGETEYVWGLIPFGGYVKMAGETALERQQTPDPPRSDELVAKSPGQRAMVFAAGAIFNIVSAFFFFILAFSIGVSFNAPEIGQVEPGKPAWEAGIRPGDRVTAINGAPIADFREIALASALGSPDEPRRFTVRRHHQALGNDETPGNDETLEFEIAPRWAPEQGLRTIGVGPAFDPTFTVKPGSAAELGGLKSGDRLEGVRIDGLEIPGLFAFQSLGEFLQLHPGKSFEVTVARTVAREGAAGPGGAPPKEILRRTIQPVRKATIPKATPLLGVTPAVSVVRGVRPGTAAEKLFHPGDRLVSFAGEPAATPNKLDLLLDRGSSPDAAEVVLESIRGERRTLKLDAAPLLDLVLSRDIHWIDEGLRIARLPPGADQTSFLRAGDVLLAAGAEPRPVFDAEGLLAALKDRGGVPAVWFRRGAAIEHHQPQGSLQEAEWKGIEWDAMPPVRVRPGGAAAIQGIPNGSRILEVAGRRLTSWEELHDVVVGSPAGKARVRWRQPDGAEREAELDLSAGERFENFEDPGLSSTYVQNPVRASVLDSFALGARRTVVEGKHVLLTLKGLLSQQVAARNLSGPVGIITVLKSVSEQDLGALLYLMALISVNLGLFNLLPFPILDGGHLFFLAIEKIKGKPVDVRIQEIATTIAFFMIIGLALFVTWHDFRRLFM